MLKIKNQLIIVLSRNNVRYKLWISILGLFLISQSMYAQPVSITGKVTDNGEPMPGVNIIIKGTQTGVVSDVNGKYSITVPNKEAVLVFSFVGYTTHEFIVGNHKEIDVALNEDTRKIEEIVVIGYGSQTKKEITGSVANVTEDNFNKGVAQNAADLLQGKVSGLVISKGTGDIMDGSNIRLRGVSTLMNDQGPFIVIDGVPGGDMSTVPPQDIESISVLKDASSAAIYGSRSAGGVILITTKKGSGSKPMISYDGYVAMETVANKPDMITADQWRQYVKDTGQDGSAFDKYGASTDWYDEIMRTGFTQNHSISVSGGASKHNYRVSFNYLDRNGIARDNSLDRYNLIFQFSQRAIRDKLRIGFTGSATLMDGQRANTRNFILASNMLPVYPVYLPDGSWFDTREYDQGNPVRNQDLNDRRNKRNYFYGSIFAEFEIITGLTAKANLYKSRNMRDYSRFDNSETEQGRDDGGYAKRQSETNDRDLMELTIDYQKVFNNHHKINLLGGYSWEENNEQGFYSQNRGFNTNYIGANSLQSGQGLRDGDVRSWKNMYRLISFFGRLNYSYNSKYMLTATLRYDGSSKFGKNNKWGVFPSFSAAWGIGDEGFMKDISWIDDLKLRAGYGVTGNQSGLSPYKTLELYDSKGIYYSNGKWLSEYKISQNANPDLKWEETSSFNIGLDFQLLNNILSGSIEWYSKQTSDMLYTYNVPSPPYMFNEMVANVGDMSNKGIEIVLNWKTMQKQNFTWDMSFSASYNKNEVTKLSNQHYTTSRIKIGDAWIRGGSSNYTSVIEEGRPLGEFYGWICDGIDEKGMFILRDLTGEGEISEEDRTYIGTPLPPWNVGLQNSFAYKNWDFSFFFRGQFGNQIMNHGRMAYANPQSLIGANARAEALTIGINEVPKYSSFYIEDGDFIRLDNLSLGYSFNTSTIDWLGKLRVYVTGQNLFVITGYSGLDPEVDMTTNVTTAVVSTVAENKTPTRENKAPGVESREFYPKARIFSFGVTATF